LLLLLQIAFSEELKKSEWALLAAAAMATILLTIFVTKKYVTNALPAILRERIRAQVLAEVEQSQRSGLEASTGIIHIFPSFRECEEEILSHVWRLFLIDDIAYAQPYLYERDNSSRAPVLKIAQVHREGPSAGSVNEKSLFSALSRYFDLKWDENLPLVKRLEEIVPQAEVCVVAAIVRYQKFYIFAVPERYVNKKSGELPFHGVGGKRAPGEDWITALQREATEELGAKLDVVSSSRTRFYTTGAELDNVALSDEPRPYCIYKRTREVDPNFAHREVLWLVGYDSALQIVNLEHLQPGSEVAALVVLTADWLRKALHEDITYKDISNSKDGSRIILAPNINFDLMRRAVPAGLAIIAAAEQMPGYLREL
jgi:8-oxo-dGTP pyrophosphatase MutT (NUDIX family)